MKALIVHAHPDPDSFNRRIVDRTITGLEAAGHTCTLLDLYRLDYRSEMSLDEHLAYSSTTTILDPLVEEHAQLVRSCDILVFVYPTWWSSTPAILKGWFERTLVRGVAFDLDERSGKLAPLLLNVRHLAGITTHGSPRWYVKIVNDCGRRTIMRSVRAVIGLRTRTTWLALYDLDGRTHAHRERFLDRVESTMSRLEVGSATKNAKNMVLE